MKIKFNDGWAFAIVNGRLAEIHFDKNTALGAIAMLIKKNIKQSENKNGLKKTP